MDITARVLASAALLVAAVALFLVLFLASAASHADMALAREMDGLAENIITLQNSLGR